jgi:hypothetical protein
MSLVTEPLGEPAGIEMGAPGAVVVNRAPVGKLRSPQIIQLGQRPERGVLQHGAEKVVGLAGGFGPHPCGWDSGRSGWA